MESLNSIQMEMTQPIDLMTPSNHLLVALPQLSDPYFSQSITLLCEHNDTGALGLVVNRPSDNTLGDMLKQLGLPCPEHLEHRKVYNGGPVGLERGFVLHTDQSEWRNTIDLRADGSLKLTTSRDIIEAIGNDAGPDQFMLVFGYAGWAAGQLEQEMDKNAWITTQIGQDLLFNTPPEDRWHKAINSLGFNMSQLSPEVGHC